MTDCTAVMKVPETRYVSVGDADVAYQIVGDGPSDLLTFFGLGSHIELAWDYPPNAAALASLASLGRLILFDRRGAGASDRIPRTAAPTWEEWTQDLDAVLDATGSEEVTIVAENEAGPIAIVYAAMRPERVRALVLSNTTARFLVAEDYPAGVSEELTDLIIEFIGSKWGTTDLLRASEPELQSDPEQVRWLARMMRTAVTPRTAAAQYRYILKDVDVRPALALVQAPTLIVHYDQNPFIPVQQGKYLADHIDGARFIELRGGRNAVPSSEFAVWTDEIAEFLTGQRPPLDVERVLTTILFTDIVGSTQTAAELGDRAWRVVLDSHDRAVREQLGRFRGREIKATGDGFVASFDGPARAIRCAQTILDASNGLGVEVRAGMHTGECEIRGDDLSGLAVHIASRVGAMASP
ncbi:MAG TPA: alpha/beta fold hydrolase, partial [Acidimicrobiales bacterium]|nr:alpha/beta fold hydrolase [Acidimicrobiales bacterium]